jgi:hypothetical protein
MGCGASKGDSHAELEAILSAATTHDQIDDELSALMQQASELNEAEFWEGANKINMSKFLARAAELGPSHQLLAAVAAASILSSEPDHMQRWAGQEEGSINAVAPTASQAAMNRFCSMAEGLISLTEASSNGVGINQVPNDAPNAATVMLVMRQRAIWSSLIQAHTVSVIEHPVLGPVVSAQPLLSSVILARSRLEPYKGSPEDIDDLLGYMINTAGADCNIPSSIGLSPLILAVDTFLSQAQYNQEDQKSTGACLKVMRVLLDAGADPNYSAIPFGKGGKSGGFNWGSGGSQYIAPFLDGDKKGATGQEGGFTALDVLLSFSSDLSNDLSQTFSVHFYQAKEMLEDAMKQGHATGIESHSVSSQLRGGRPRIMKVPWSHACYNILWSVSQVTASRDVRKRRKILASVRTKAPFILPAMTVVSVPQLRSLGKIPRYSSKDDQPFTPIPIEEIGPDGYVVFLSHRWLGNGCPDDEKGTKLGQVYEIADKLAAFHKKKPEDIFFWIDYSVCDQSDPMPGVQMLPVYIACCDAFVYCDHPQYDERAWCLTEQFMFYKLSGNMAEGRGGGEERIRKFRLCFDGSLEEKRASDKPKDPSLGRLAFEGDRVALATMVSILPY